jgi:hypothetical protein
MFKVLWLFVYIYFIFGLQKFFSISEKALTAFSNQL